MTTTIKMYVARRYFENGEWADNWGRCRNDETIVPCTSEDEAMGKAKLFYVYDEGIREFDENAAVVIDTYDFEYDPAKAHLFSDANKAALKAKILSEKPLTHNLVWAKNPELAKKYA